MRVNRVVQYLAAPGAVVIAFAAVCGFQPSTQIGVSSHLTFNESLRKEIKTTTESGPSSSSSETEEVTLTKWSVNGDLTLTDNTYKPIDQSTRFRFILGGFEYQARLGDDPNFADGKTSATLSVKQNNKSGLTQTILVSLQLKWDKSKLHFKVDTKALIPTSIAAKDLTDKMTGDVEAEAHAVIEFANEQVDFVVPFKGHVVHKSASAGGSISSVSGQAITVDIKGDGKTA